MTTPAKKARWFGKDVSKKPLKVNVFASMTAHQGMLEQIPLFPYFGPGDIVPTAALSLSLADMPRVHFYHYNDIPEVILTMAGDGALLASGQLYLQQGTHGVTTFLRKPRGAEAQAYVLALVIIRMKGKGPQNEGFILRCHACNEVVFRMDRDVFHGPEHRYYPELANVRFYADAADAFNAEPRTCAACHAVQERFPVEIVGWRRYAQYVELANRARADLEAAAARSKE
ncbi:MAG TPA: hypothetical protein VF765_26130 [Polyangiaceae bacterium]